MDYPKILDNLNGYGQADNYIKINMNKAIQEINKYYPKCNNMQSLNGIIGGKNSTYNVDASNYNSHIDYYLEWKKGHFEKYMNDALLPFDRTSINIYRALQENFLEEFISVYLSRTYFKKHNIK